MNLQYMQSFATSYGCGAYGAGSFDEGSCSTSKTPPRNSGPLGGLVNTGMNVYLPLAGGVILIIIAIIILVRGLKKRRQSTND